ncbi:MAG: hypothetical protein NC349_05585 [Paenibacillus sp.]|nr:hypothetical protein [Paenibacillus sp.]
MRRRKLSAILMSICASLVISFALPSCGTVHGHWGVGSEYEIPFDGHHHHKPPKHKKHKKPKYKKHKKHHHHDDDDD